MVFKVNLPHCQLISALILCIRKHQPETNFSKKVVKGVQNGSSSPLGAGTSLSLPSYRLAVPEEGWRPGQVSHGEDGQWNTNAWVPTGAPGETHLAESTHSTLRLPGGHQKPSGHQAAAWEGRGQSLGLVGLCRRRKREERVWDCKGVKTLDEADEGIGRDVAPRVATTTLGTWCR